MKPGTAEELAHQIVPYKSDGHMQCNVGGEQFAYHLACEL
jgi:hypothetical protein